MSLTVGGRRNPFSVNACLGPSLCLLPARVVTGFACFWRVPGAVRAAHLWHSPPEELPALPDGGTRWPCLPFACLPCGVRSGPSLSSPGSRGRWWRDIFELFARSESYLCSLISKAREGAFSCLLSSLSHCPSSTCSQGSHLVISKCWLINA